MKFGALISGQYRVDKHATYFSENVKTLVLKIYKNSCE